MLSIQSISKYSPEQNTDYGPKRVPGPGCSWSQGSSQVQIVFLVLVQVFRVLRFTARVGGRRTPYREWFLVCVCLCMCLCLCVCVFLCPSLPDSVPPSYPLILPTLPPFRFDWNHRCRHTDTQTQTRDKDTDTQTHTHTHTKKPFPVWCPRIDQFLLCKPSFYQRNCRLGL